MKMASLVIKARDLDSDTQHRATSEVVIPGTPAERRQQMIEAVRASHPDASIRSFDEAGATFLDRDNLIVTFYEDVQALDNNTQTGDDEQQELFAA
ncbi:MAG: hypothetical protein ACR2NA_11715 [Solirubrobacterales bacterium]